MKKGIKTVITIGALVGVIGGAAMVYQTLRTQVTPPPQLIAENGGEIASVPVEPSPSQVSESTEAGDMDQKKMAPDFSVTDAQGNTVILSDLRGKPVVLNFWASWCPPCKSEMPVFEAAYQELGSEIQFLMVDVTDGKRETVEIAAAFIAEQGYTFPIFFDTQYEASYQYNVQSIPKTYFIDQDGYLVVGAQGAIDEETLRRGIDMIR